MTKKRILHEITLTKIATVDFPCQEHAIAVLVKKKGSDTTSDEAGIAGKTDNKGDIMSEINKALGLPDTATEAQVLEAIAKMNTKDKANEKAKLDAEAEAKKLKDEAETKEKARKAADLDEQFASFDGNIVKKSEVGASYLVMKSMNDELIKARVAAETTELVKRAETEFANIPCGLDAKVSILRLAKSAPENARIAIDSVLKGYSEMIDVGMQTLGKRAAKDVGGDPESKLEDMAKRRSTEDKISFESAYVKVLETNEGAALYAQIQS
jgi:hypothetical protein